jgi:hypothetical protein
MTEKTPEPAYKIWAVDDVVYGPVELTTLVDWVGDERVVAGTWVFSLASETWSRANELPELKMFFGESAPAATEPKDRTPLVPGIRPGTLRRVKIFASMTDQQLGRFAQLMQVESVPAFREIVKRGGPGDAMYAVLEGEVRARILVGGKETTLATFQAGDVFGEITLFDDGARSADVIANVDSSLLKIPAEKFDRLCTDHPDLATPLLLALGKTLTARIRNDNKRLGEMITISRAGE